MVLLCSMSKTGLARHALPELLGTGAEQTPRTPGCGQPGGSTPAVPRRAVRVGPAAAVRRPGLPGRLDRDRVGQVAVPGVEPGRLGAQYRRAGGAYRAAQTRLVTTNRRRHAG